MAKAERFGQVQLSKRHQGVKTELQVSAQPQGYYKRTRRQYGTPGGVHFSGVDKPPSEQPPSPQPSTDTNLLDLLAVIGL